jgi:hypothetical protein
MAHPRFPALLLALPDDFGERDFDFCGPGLPSTGTLSGSGESI